IVGSHEWLFISMDRTDTYGPPDILVHKDLVYHSTIPFPQDTYNCATKQEWAEERIGMSVSPSGSVLAVTGTTANCDDPDLPQGMVYLYTYSDTSRTWGLAAQIEAPGTLSDPTYPVFGSSVSMLSDRYIAVGATDVQNRDDIGTVLLYDCGDSLSQTGDVDADTPSCTLSMTVPPPDVCLHPEDQKACHWGGQTLSVDMAPSTPLLSFATLVKTDIEHSVTNGLAAVVVSIDPLAGTSSATILPLPLKEDVGYHGAQIAYVSLSSPYLAAGLYDSETLAMYSLSPAPDTDTDTDTVGGDSTDTDPATYEWTLDQIITGDICTEDSLVPICSGYFGTAVSLSQPDPDTGLPNMGFHVDDCLHEYHFEQVERGCIVQMGVEEGEWALQGAVQSLTTGGIGSGESGLVYTYPDILVTSAFDASEYLGLGLTVAQAPPTLPVRVEPAPSSISLGQTTLEDLRLKFYDSVGNILFFKGSTIEVAISGGDIFDTSILFPTPDFVYQCYRTPPLVFGLDSLGMGAVIEVDIQHYGSIGVQGYVDVNVAPAKLTVDLTSLCGKTDTVDISPLYLDSSLDGVETTFTVSLTNAFGAAIVDARQVLIGTSDTTQVDMLYDTDSATYSARLVTSDGDHLHVTVYNAGSSFKTQEWLRFSSVVVDAYVSPSYCQLYMPTTFCAHMSDAYMRTVGGDLASPSLRWSTDPSSSVPAEWDQAASAYCGALVPETPHPHADSGGLTSGASLSIDVVLNDKVLASYDVAVLEPLQGADIMGVDDGDLFGSGFVAAHSDLLFIADPSRPSVRVYRVNTHNPGVVFYSLLAEAEMWFDVEYYSQYDTYSIAYDPSTSFLAVSRYASYGPVGVFMYRFHEDELLVVGSVEYGLDRDHDSGDFTGLIAMAGGVLVVSNGTGATVLHLNGQGVWEEEQDIVMDLGNYYRYPSLATDGTWIAIGYMDQHSVLVYARDSVTGKWTCTDQVESPFPTSSANHFGNSVAIYGDMLLVTNDSLPDTSDMTGPPLYAFRHKAETASESVSDTTNIGGPGSRWELVATLPGATVDTEYGQSMILRDGTFAYTDTNADMAYVYNIDGSDNSLNLVRSVYLPGGTESEGVSSDDDSVVNILDIAFSGETLYLTGVLTEDASAPTSIATVYSGPASTSVIGGISVKPSVVHCTDTEVEFKVTLLEEDGTVMTQDMSGDVSFVWCDLTPSVTYDPVSYVYSVAYTDTAACTSKAGTGTFSVSINSQSAPGISLSQSGASVPMSVEYDVIASISLLGDSVFYADGDPVVLEVQVIDAQGAVIEDGRTARGGWDYQSFTAVMQYVPSVQAYAYYMGDVAHCFDSVFTLYIAPDRQTTATSDLVPYPVSIMAYTDIYAVGVTPNTVSIGEMAHFTITGYDACNTVVPSDMSMSVEWYPETDPALATPCAFSEGDATYTVDMQIPQEATEERPVLQILTAAESSPVLVAVTVNLGDLASVDISPTKVSACTGDVTFTVTPYNGSGTVMVDTSSQLTVYFEDQPEERYLASVCEDCAPLAYRVTVDDTCGVRDRTLAIAVASQTTPVSTLSVTIVYSAPWWYALLALGAVGVLVVGVMLYRARGRGGYSSLAKEESSM
ncbi:hypothetical protein KIPB_005019, partial [Kipferlia bialata]